MDYAQIEYIYKPAITDVFITSEHETPGSARISSITSPKKLTHSEK